MRPRQGGATFRARFSEPIVAGTDDVVVRVRAPAGDESVPPHEWMSNRELGREALGANLRGDHEAADALWRELLARSLTEQERAVALTEYASVLGHLERHEEQETALRSAIDLAGPSSVRGLQALSRLAWARHWRGDSAASLALIEDAMRSPDPVQAAGARWSAGRFATAVGDHDRARDLLTTLRDELTASPDTRLRRLLPQVEV